MIIKTRISVYDVKEAKYLLNNQVVTNIETKNENGVYNSRRGETEGLAHDGAVAQIGRAIAQSITERWPQTPGVGSK